MEDSIPSQEETAGAAVPEISLDEERTEEVRMAFALFNTGNGYMDVRNISNAMAALGMPISREELRKVLDELDSRRQIEFLDLVHIVEQKMAVDAALHALASVFADIASNRSHGIGANDLRLVFAEMEKAISDEEIAEMVSMADANMGDRVGLADFLSMMVSLGKDYTR